MGAKKFRYNPSLEDLDKYILTKNQFAEWADLDRHRFRYYLRTGQLNKLEREKIAKMVSGFAAEFNSFAKRLLE